jgi:hypothetical protein
MTKTGAAVCLQYVGEPEAHRGQSGDQVLEQNSIRGLKIGKPSQNSIVTSVTGNPACDCFQNTIQMNFLR